LRVGVALTGLAAQEKHQPDLWRPLSGVLLSLGVRYSRGRTLRLKRRGGGTVPFRRVGRGSRRAALARDFMGCRSL